MNRVFFYLVWTTVCVCVCVVCLRKTWNQDARWEEDKGNIVLGSLGFLFSYWMLL